MRQIRLHASWALPVDAAPIPDAALLIGSNGRIAAIGPAAAVPAPPDAETWDLGDAILLPGLVNTHTHLELTGFQETSAESNFPRWILGIRRLKQARSPEEYLAAARSGLRECWAGGVTTIADTGDSGAVLRALAELGGSGIAYQEVFGPDPAQIGESFRGLECRIEELRSLAGDRVRLGVSPHAAYTVSGPLLGKVARWAERQGLSMAVHLAESPAESEFVTRGMGPFADAWRARGIPLLDQPAQQPSGRPAVRPASPVAWLDAHGVLGPGTLCIHAVRLTGGDIGVLALRGVSVAHCPVSNARHGHGAAPLAALRAAGIRVGIGTDSAASVGRLDLFAEARAAQALAGLSDQETLALATTEGARAVGLESEIGTLTPGKWGDVIAVRRVGNAPESGIGRGTSSTVEPPARQVVGASPAGVVLTVLGGRIVHRLDPT